nr:zinc finger protein 287 isoform X1 [Helicoverpa armigera]
MSDAPGYLDGVCEGCLSPERQQPVEITDIEIKKLFFEILNQAADQNIENLKLRLCSECKSSIKKFLTFRQQVQDAHEILSRHLIASSHTTLPSQPTDSYTKTPRSVSDVKTSIDVTPKELAFIKVEDGLDDGGCYMDDGQGGDEDFKTVLKPEISQPNQLDISVSYKTKEDDFNESDDEPLHKKRSKKGAGEKRGRKKKKEDALPKIDRRKCPGPKRERPPGVVDNPRVRQKLKQLNVPDGMLECVVLSWEEVEAERQRGLSSAAYSGQQYRCAHCVLGFNHRAKLLAHMNKHDASAGPLECNVCHVRCKHAHALSAHKRRHRLRWRCTVCGHTMSRAGVAADHCSRRHTAPPPQHTCRLCGHTDALVCYVSLAKLRSHMKSHAERQRCELCGKTFRDRTSLRTHLFIHSGEKEFSCSRCDKRFLFKKAMQVHAMTHDAHANLYCYQCDVTFKNRMSYTQHMKYSLKHVDPAQLKYACTSCDKRFLKASRLHDHTLAVHLKATPVHCSVPGCSFACASRPVLRAHMRSRHRDAAPRRNHVCHTCGKAYLTKKSLEGHLRAHSGERPFRCAVCAASFGYEAALYNHTRLVHLKHKLGRSVPPPAPPAPDIP